MQFINPILISNIRRPGLALALLFPFVAHGNTFATNGGIKSDGVIKGEGITLINLGNATAEEWHKILTPSQSNHKNESAKDHFYQRRKNITSQLNKPMAPAQPQCQSNEPHRATPSYPTPQTIGVNFLAGTQTDMANITAFNPDQFGAVGPEQFVAYTFGGMRSFNKVTGESDNVLEVSCTTLFPLYCSDNMIKYDKFSDRWFAINTSRSLNEIDIAVSDTGTLTDCTQWQLFVLPFDQIFPPGDPHPPFIIDSPSMGIDSQAVYIGVEVIGPVAPFGATSAAVVIEKNSLIAGTPFATVFRDLVDADGHGMYDPWGVDNFDEPTPEFGYFVGVDTFPQFVAPGTSNIIIFQRVINPGSTDPLNRPTLTSQINSTVDTAQVSYNFSAPQPGNLFGDNGRILALFPRLESPHIRNGQLFTTHCIPVNAQGISGNGDEDRNGARWYQFDLSAGGTETATTVPTVVQFGTLFDNTLTTSPIYYYFPTIMTNKQGDLILTCNSSSDNQFVNMVVAGRLGSQPLDGSLGIPKVIFQSLYSYNAYMRSFVGTVPPADFATSFSFAAERFGDRAYTSIDPTDELSMWSIQEIVAAPNNWGLYVAQILPPAA